ncbi:MAG TPA: hypothetical protein VFC51_03770 [Chloroflexota bacterium]|nr:hypothetical protein [Chloroflexota bacterium]
MTIAVSPNGRNNYQTASPANKLLIATFDGIVTLVRSGAGAAWANAGRELQGRPYHAEGGSGCAPIGS